MYQIVLQQITTHTILNFFFIFLFIFSNNRTYISDDNNTFKQVIDRIYMRKEITCLLVLFIIGLGSAVIPTPHGFEGNVYYSDGTLIQPSLEITAKINDVEKGGDSLSNGAYDLVVESESGGTIYFYIDGQSSSIGNYVFDSFAITELDFATLLSNPDTEDTSSSSSTTSSGGGSSGGSSSSNSIITLETNDNVEQEPEQISLAGSQKTSGITGGAIGFSESGIGVGIISALIIIFIGAAVVVLKKTSPKASGEKDDK